MPVSLTLAQVLDRPDVWRGDTLARAPLPGVPTGFAELDRELPGGGWPRGGLTEILPLRRGIGELSLLLPALARLSSDELAWLVCVAPPHLLQAPVSAVPFALYAAYSALVGTVYAGQSLADLPFDSLVTVFKGNVTTGRCRAAEAEQRFYADSLVCDTEEAFAARCEGANATTGCTLEPRDHASLEALVQTEVIQPEVLPVSYTHLTLPTSDLV